MFPTFMYKHYYMKQYNCVFCAFPLLSVCLTSFAQILTTNENWILFLAFLKIMWTIFGCKWHFPISWHNIWYWTWQKGVPRKKKLIKKNQGVAGRWSKLIMRLHLSLCLYILNKWLNMYHCKDLGKYIFSSLSV